MAPHSTDDRLHTSSMDGPGTDLGAAAAAGSVGGAAGAPSATAASVAVDGRLTFAGALRAELTKIRVLRSSWWLAGISLLLVVGFSLLALSAFSAMRVVPEQVEGARMPSPSDADLLEQLLSMGTGGLSFGAILLGCVGIIAISSEFGTGSIRSSVTAVPRRGLFVAAKLGAVVITAALAGAVLVAGVLAVLLPFAAGQDLLSALEPSMLWHVAFTNWLSVVIVTVLACGLGLLLRSTAGAIVTLTMFLFVVQIALSILTGMTQGADIVEFLSTWEFSNLLSSLSQLREPTGEPYDLSVSTGTAVLGLLGWLAAVLVPATLLFRRRDV